MTVTKVLACVALLVAALALHAHSYILTCSIVNDYAAQCCGQPNSLELSVYNDYLMYSLYDQQYAADACAQAIHSAAVSVDSGQASMDIQYYANSPTYPTEGIFPHQLTTCPSYVQSFFKNIWSPVSAIVAFSPFQGYTDYCQTTAYECLNKLTRQDEVWPLYPAPHYKLFPCEFSTDLIDVHDVSSWGLGTYCSDVWGVPLRTLYGTRVPSTTSYYYTDVETSLGTLASIRHITVIDTVAELFGGLSVTTTSSYQYTLTGSHPMRLSVQNSLDFNFNSTAVIVWLDFLGGSLNTTQFPGFFAFPSTTSLRLLTINTASITQVGAAGWSSLLETAYPSGQPLGLTGFEIVNCALSAPTNTTTALNPAYYTSLQFLKVSQMDWTNVSTVLPCTSTLNYLNMSYNSNVAANLTPLLNCTAYNTLDLSHTQGVYTNAVSNTTSTSYALETPITMAPGGWLSLSYTGLTGSVTTLFSQLTSLSYLGLQGLSGITGSLPFGFTAAFVQIDYLTNLNSNPTLGLCAFGGVGPIPACVV